MAQSVAELRKILVDSGKFTQEQADSIKGKSKLSELVLALEQDDVDVTKLFDSMELEQEASIDGPVNAEKKPDRLSEDWQAYVLSQFKPEELDNGYPKLIGLRRVASKLMGNIISSLPTKLDTIVDDRNVTGRTSCVYEIIFDTPLGPVKYGSAASSWSGNTDDEFVVYTEAIAESRAESRALRKALNLNMVSKEETTSKNIKEVIANLQQKDEGRSGAWEGDAEISAPQEMMIKKLAERLEIDLDKFLAKENLGALNTISKIQATGLIDLLNKYSSNSKESVVIPVEIKKVS